MEQGISRGTCNLFFPSQCHVELIARSLQNNDLIVVYISLKEPSQQRHSCSVWYMSLYNTWFSKHSGEYSDKLTGLWSDQTSTSIIVNHRRDLRICGFLSLVPGGAASDLPWILRAACGCTEHLLHFDLQLSLLLPKGNLDSTLGINPYSGDCSWDSQLSIAKV